MRDRLKELWEEHLAAPFPALENVHLTADLAEYHGHIAGIVSTMVTGGRASPAAQPEIDDGLARRIGNTGSAEAISYVDRLNELARPDQNHQRSTGSER